MDRLQFDDGETTNAFGRPDMTVVEAADEMERTRRTRLLVRQEHKLVGVLTETDIVRKVLAAGRRPDAVRVSDIMALAEQASDGSLLLPAEPIAEELEYGLPLEHLTQGKCEECGDLNVDLEEHDGLLLCPDCLDGDTNN